MPICTTCNHDRDESEFHVTPGKARDRWCLVCRARYYQERHQAKKDGTWTPKGARKPPAEQEHIFHALISPTTEDLHWCAGFIEAEGCFAGGQVTAKQVDVDLLIKLQDFFGGTVREECTNTGSIYKWFVSGARARGVAMTLYALLSIRRQNQIREMLGKPAIPDYIAPALPRVELDLDFPTCAGCGLEKPAVEFPLTRKSKKPAAKCLTCLKEYRNSRGKEVRKGTWEPGTQGLMVGKATTPPATVSPSTADLYWLTGFLDGEGHFRGHGNGDCSEVVTAAQKNPEPIYKLQQFLGGSITPGHGSVPTTWRAQGARARGIMLTLFTLLSSRRREQITSAVA